MVKLCPVSRLQALEPSQGNKISGEREDREDDTSWKGQSFDFDFYVSQGKGRVPEIVRFLSNYTRKLCPLKLVLGGCTG